MLCQQRQQQIAMSTQDYHLIFIHLGLLSGSTASPFYCRYPVVRSFGKISLAMVSEQATNERVSLVVPTSKTTNQSNIGT